MATQGHTKPTTFLEKLIRPAVWPQGAVSIPRLQAHRGFRFNGEQENTLLAFQAAKKAGAEMIELDVQLSADQVPVVFHDQDISRFSSKKNVKVSELTAKQIQELVNAPTLEEVIENQNVPSKINVELKTDRIIDEALERKVFEIIKKTNSFNRILISSFNPFSLWRMSLYSQDLPRALIVSPDLKNPILRNMWSLFFLSIHLVHLDKNMISPEVVNKWSGLGLPVVAWTMTEQSEIQKYLSMGCISVISDIDEKPIAQEQTS